MKRAELTKAQVNRKSTDRQDDDLSLAERVYKRLREGIRAGDFRPGHRLREADLATKLKVSRTPVREAIRRLSADGLVEVSSSRGMRIIDLNTQQVRELYSLREVLEGTAARMAAQHASAGELETMEELLLAGERTHEPVKIAIINRSLHKAIHEAAHNRYLSLALTQLSDSLGLLPGTTYELPNRPETAHSEHVDILKAIKSRKPIMAEKLMRHHIAVAGVARIKMIFGA
jgi:DNA-binding GntR family transcriptional regulator